MTGRLAYHKVLVSKKPADSLTKHVSAELLSRHFVAFQTEAGGGRAESAPELNSLGLVITVLIDGESRGLEDVEEPAAMTWDSKGTKKAARKVAFCERIQYRAVPLGNNGRWCQGGERAEFQGRVQVLQSCRARRVAVRGVAPRPS